ncbi:rotundifolia-like protein [Cinnamomum micranthum f. kanehirae]|uniref:Rotundifolia-like protein n=1 Tax=Cinnamomum micranthum f. kanehirae TaxID=337451 RepID=A0A443P5S9_9MAGN|nr:rotundifolia-like protein [Cinnamomum micranthum f. kanehirae]
MAVAAAPPLYFDEKWKLSKKEGRGSFLRSSSRGRSSFTRKCATLVKEQRASLGALGKIEGNISPFSLIAWFNYMVLSKHMVVMDPSFSLTWSYGGREREREREILSEAQLAVALEFRVLL